MGEGTEGKGDAPNSSACWFYRIRAAQSAVRSPDDALRDVIKSTPKFGLSYLLLQCVVFVAQHCHDQYTFRINDLAWSPCSPSEPNSISIPVYVD